MVSEWQHWVHLVGIFGRYSTARAPSAHISHISYKGVRSIYVYIKNKPSTDYYRCNNYPMAAPSGARGTGQQPSSQHNLDNPPWLSASEATVCHFVSPVHSGRRPIQTVRSRPSKMSSEGEVAVPAPIFCLRKSLIIINVSPNLLIHRLRGFSKVSQYRFQAAIHNFGEVETPNELADLILSNVRNNSCLDHGIQVLNEHIPTCMRIEPAQCAGIMHWWTY